MEVPTVGMHITFDEKTGLFRFCYISGKESIFQVTMSFQEFETLAIDMMGIVKSFNLEQARAYIKKMEVENEQNKVEDRKAICQGLEGPPEQPTDNQQA